MKQPPEPFTIGWEEWVALPELGLPAIKAKVDTGARTSALHAFMIEPFGSTAAPMVRFGIHPIPGRDDIEVYCTSNVVDRREVTSSNGEKERRVFIRTPLAMGERTWTVEIGLTNREAMSYRMLLGRQAIRADMMIDPRSSFHQPRLSYRLYRHLPRHEPVRRALRIAVVSKSLRTHSDRLLAAAAAAAGHVLQPLDLRRLELDFDPAAPGLLLDGAAAGQFDAVIPRIGIDDGRFGAAVVRQLELMGSFAVNTGDALDRRANPLALTQTLIAAGLTVDLPTSAEDAAKRRRRSRTRSSEAPVRVLVVGGRAVAATSGQSEVDSSSDGSGGRGLRRHRSECTLAARAASALRLGLAAVDVDGTGASPCVRAVTARPALGDWGSAAGMAAAESVIELIEVRSRAAGRRGTTTPP